MPRPVGHNYFSFAICFLLFLYAGGTGLSFAQSVSNGVHLVPVPFVADKVRWLPDGSIVLASERERRVQRRNAQGDEPPLWNIPLDQSIADISISKAEAGDLFISFAGALDEKGPVQKTVVSRVNVNTGVYSRIVLDIGSGQPTITIGKSPSVKGENLYLGASESLYLGASDSETIYRLDEQSFEERPSPELRAVVPEVLATNHDLFGVSDLTQIGQVLLVSSRRPRGVSAYDLRLRKWIGYLPVLISKLPGSAPFPLKLNATDETALDENVKASILVADFGPVNRLLLAELDEAFGVFQTVQSVDLDFAAPGPAANDPNKSPLLLASDRGQKFIVVGSQSSREIFIYKRNGRAIELRGSRTLATPPVDISVSRDGSAIAILMSGGSQLEILQPESLPDSITPSSDEQSQLLKAQEALSQLGYPVGSVDGKPGPQTTDAISLFQSRTGLKVTGKLDPDTLKKILTAGQH